MRPSGLLEPAEHHTNLYRYWDTKRAGRPTPCRRDIDPTEIVPLLPYLAIVENDGDGYRWRLMGTAIANDFGRDLTGQPFGGYVAPTPFVQIMTSTFDRVLGTGTPAFQESVFRTTLGANQWVSRLVLPLSLDDGRPCKAIFTRIARFSFAAHVEHDQLKAATGELLRTYDISSIDDLQCRVLDWDRRTTVTNADRTLAA